MTRVAAVAMALVLAASECPAQAGPASSPAHATREDALALLRREGILGDTTRVTSATWNGTFWIISLRTRDGTVANWTVDAAAKEYSYICKH